MTYLNGRPQTLLTSNPPESGHGDVQLASGPSLFQALVRFALQLMAQYYAMHGKRGPETRKLLVFTLAVLLFLYQGTAEEKRAFLKRLMAEHQDTHDRLLARYLVWRQRKCWMWGGGYRAGCLASMPGLSAPMPAGRSFAALIPD